MELSNDSLNSQRLTLQAIFPKLLYWNSIASQNMFSLHSMCLGCLIEKLLGNHIEEILTTGLLMHQNSTNKNQTSGTNLKDLMQDVIGLELGCKKEKC